MKELDTAIFAGGCFWCMVHPFDEMPGVEQVISGYTGGHTKNPNYEQVKAGSSGHTEAVKITFNPDLMSYDKLLDIYWSSMDPTDAEGQFFDRGASYRPVIYVNSAEQKTAAEASKAALEASGRFDKPIVVPIEDAVTFYDAEDYHQDFYKTNANHYERYAKASGRQSFIDNHRVDQSNNL